MRVLFVPREDATSIFGGDVVQMRATADRLRLLGVQIDIGPPQQAFDAPYDIVHLWTSLHFPHALAPQLNILRSRQLAAKIALSTIWAPHQLVRWMDTARRWLFGQYEHPSAITLENARPLLQQIADRSLDFTVDGRTLSAFAPHPMTPECRDVLRRVDVILPNSWMELQAIFSFLGDFCAHHVVPNAVDASLFSNGDPEQIPKDLIGKKFALMSARFDPRKQQDFAMLSMLDSELPLVFVGDRSAPEISARVEGLSHVRRAAVYCIPLLPQEQLKHLYCAASVHVLPSLFESPGLASLEAALLDCSVVVGNLAFESEYFREEAYYCDPCNAFSIGRAVELATSEHAANADRRATLRKRIAEEYTWEAAARETLRAYENTVR